MAIPDFEIPGYDIIEAIGRGGMASVYRARQHTFDRNVALKILKPDLSEDDAFCQRFMMESLIVAKLNHSHIVQVYDVGEMKNHYYIAMEFLSGGDLHSRLKQGLPISEAVSIIKQIGLALDFAHRKHIIHRDLKPDNVMFREDEAAVLTDFGIAKETNADINLTQTGLIVGTPKYMSPEQIRGAEPSPEGDIYSLGVMFYQLLVNRVPFEGPDLVATAYKHFNEPVPQLPTHLKHFQSLLDAMLAKSVNERIDRGNDVVKELERLEKQYPLEPCQGETIQVATEDNSKTVVKQSVIETKVANKKVIDKPIASQPTIANIRESTTPAKNDAPSSDPKEVVTDNASESTQFRIRKKTPIVYAGLGLAGLLAAITIGLQTLNKPVETTPVPLQKPVFDHSAKITRLLVAAQKDIDERRLQKGTSNALEKYRHILHLSPEHPQALKGINNIADTYLELATEAIDSNQLEKAQDFINSATELNPSIETLALQQKMDGAIANRAVPSNNILDLKQEMMIGGLLKNAAEYEKEGKLFSPKGSNALENYRKILEIDPTHQEAKNKLVSLEKKR